MGYGPEECPLCYLSGHGNNHTNWKTGLICCHCLEEAAEDEIHHRVLWSLVENSDGGRAERPESKKRCDVCGKIRMLLFRLSLCDDHRFGSEESKESEDEETDK